MSLELRWTSLPAVQRRHFDVAAATQDTMQIEQHTARLAQRGDSLLSDLAVGHMLAAAADIQRTIATMKANALGDAVAQLGKPVEMGLARWSNRRRHCPDLKPVNT